MRSTYETAGDAASDAWAATHAAAIACGMSARDAAQLAHICWTDALAEHGWSSEELAAEAERRMAARRSDAGGVCLCGLEECVCPKKK